MGTTKGRTGEKGGRAVFVPTVDLPILATLPQEGTMLGKYKPLALTAKAICGRLDNELTSQEMNGRLRVLKLLGLVVSLPVLPADKLGWQITKAGLARLNVEGSA